MLTCNSLMPGAFLSALLTAPFLRPDGLEARLSRLVEAQIGEAWQIRWFDAGRSALGALLDAYRIGPGDDVIVPAYTCVVVPNQIAARGARIVFCDVQESTLSYDWEALSRAMTPATRAVIVPHNFGMVSRVPDAVRARYPGVRFLDDAAHGLGSLDNRGRWLGTGHDGAFFSFEYSKNLTGGVGGLALLPASMSFAGMPVERVSRFGQWRLAVTLAGHLLSIRTALAGRAWMALARRTGLIYRSGDDEVRDGAVHAPKRLATLSAALILPQLRRLAAIREAKAVLADRYRNALADLPGVTVWEAGPDVHWVRYPFRLAAARGDKMAMARRLADASGLPVGIWFDDPIHPRGSFRHGYMPGDCPEGERLAAEVFNLPVNIALAGDGGLDDKLGRLRTAIGELAW
ncbi:DegT/DnrJ/EryC1/StrS family aminotransferase [Paludibacterium paludis]|uniref:dTDP-4-amino-4,6-dideoxygalactose transaminase n=1 Tax=Paludibacterium paludis TaxID=1225769 RepID=A0A918UAR8_9NEIS|nr:DegT/DnrJ/EryC1/StrS family aminotransferase [Paludibacterium paludis]GGY18577.1 hypothetical protein GCM10011289_22640 [Paludibacterium paludis]